MKQVKILELEGVSYEYRGGQKALIDIGLCVNEGESVTILGTNGSGKSTLLYILQGLTKPSSGSVRAFGGEVFDDSARARMGLLFQNSQAQLFSLTVWEELLFGPLQRGVPVSEAEKRAEDILGLLGISHLRERSPWQLSGGEMKKVALGTCLSTNPDVFLLDEPTSGLDPRSQVELIELVMALKKAGKTVITATHDLHIIQDISERAVIIGEDHRVLAEDTPSGILAKQDIL